MYDYSDDVASVIEALEEFGRTMTLRALVQSGSAFDPTVTNSDTPVIGVMVNYEDGQVDGTLIKAGDKLFLTHSAVTISDKIVDEGIEYSIVPPVKKVKPGGTTLLYKVQVRA